MLRAKTDARAAYRRARRQLDDSCLRRPNAPARKILRSVPGGLIEAPAGALQVSPLFPGAVRLASLGDRSLAGCIMSAPPGTLERRRQLALGLGALAPGARLTALAPNSKGGSRLRKELEAFGCVVEESAKHHHRICTCVRPDPLVGTEQAIVEGAQRWIESVSMWSQPGVFSWDRLDPGSTLLSQRLPPLTGVGADLGCGIGHLAKTVLRSPGVKRLIMLDIDRRAIEAARRNIDDPRADLHWADVTAMGAGGAGPAADTLTNLDFVVTNPPFHDGGAEDRELGKAFIRRAAQALRKGGTLWLVANRHLPYEPVLTSAFTRVDARAEHGGYKIFEARR